MKSIADILAETREYLEAHGWTRGHMRDRRNGQVCLMGAVVWSQGWYTNPLAGEISAGNPHLPELAQVSEVLGKTLGLDDRVTNGVKRNWLPVVANWNDRKAKDKQEVLDLLAKAEKIERAGYDPDEGVEV